MNLNNKGNRNPWVSRFGGCQEMASAAWALAITLERRHRVRRSEILGRLRQQAVARVDELDGKDATSAQTLDMVGVWQTNNPAMQNILGSKS